MNFKTKILLFLFVGMVATQATAQLKYGFKTGLNFANIGGPSELDNSGASLESWKNVVGFHIGVSFGYKFSDHFGARAEALYSKRGGQYTYDGPSYRFFNYTGGVSYATGRSKYLININNSYIDIPLTVYGRAGDFEFTAGGYVGFLIQSAGEGSHLFSDGVTESNLPIEDVEYFLDHNYRKDKPGQAVEGTEFRVVRVDNRNLEIPRTIGAYYDAPEGSGKLYNSLDYGLIGGISYYLSGALYVSARVQYGLADITNNAADYAKSRTGDGKALLLRDDKDHNFAIQASVGFSF